MAREKQDYRDNLEMLKEMYPGKAVISIDEACALLRRNRKTLLKDRAFPAMLIGNKYAISIVGLARYLS